jgi:hypothetical protein
LTHVQADVREDGHVDGEWLDDAFGPDAVRVTFCFTTAVSRYAQALSGIGIAGSILMGDSRIRVGPSPWRRLRPQLLGALEKVVTGYVLAIEADGSKPVYLRRPTREAIIALAENARAAVVAGGVSVLADFRS